MCAQHNQTIFFGFKRKYTSQFCTLYMYFSLELAHDICATCPSFVAAIIEVKGYFC